MGRKVRDVLLFLAAIAGCIVLTIALGGENILGPAMIYNFVFLGVMIIIYIVALGGGVFRLTNVSSWLTDSADQIDDMDPRAPLEEKIRKIDTFRPFGKNLNRFLMDIRRSQSGICDIEDYVNEEEVEGYAHKRILDLIPEILTSLGILGTFVGLVWGLRSFEPSTYETMTTSVGSLVDGIKVAFMTSIYGLLLSILFSSSLKSGYQVMENALGLFLDRFHARVVPSAEMEVQNSLINNQKEQNEMMRSLTREFSDQVAHGFAENMAPTLEKINLQLGSMMTSISTNQQLFLKDIVSSFVREMKEAFSTEFSQFGETLNLLNEATNRNIAYSQQTSQKMAEDLEAAFAKDEQNMHAAMASVSAMQSRMQVASDQMLEQYQQALTSYTQAQEKALANLERSEKESAAFWVACNQTMQNYLQEAAKSYEEFGEVREAMEKSLQDIGSIYQTNGKILEGYQAQLQELKRTQDLTNSTLESIRKVFSSLEVAGRDGKQIILYPGLAARLSKESEQRIVKTLENRIEESEARQQESMEEIRRSIRKLNDPPQKKNKWFS